MSSPAQRDPAGPGRHRSAFPASAGAWHGPGPRRHPAFPAARLRRLCPPVTWIRQRCPGGRRSPSPSPARPRALPARSRSRPESTQSTQSPGPGNGGRASPRPQCRGPFPSGPGSAPPPRQNKAPRRPPLLCPRIPPAQQSLPGFPGSATGQGGWAGEREQRSPSPSATHACFYSMRSLPPPAASDGAEEEEEAGKRRRARAGPGGGSGAQPSSAEPRGCSPRGGDTGPLPCPGTRCHPPGSLTTSCGRGWGSAGQESTATPGICGAGLPSLDPGGFGLKCEAGASGTRAFPPPRDARRGCGQRREADTAASSHRQSSTVRRPKSIVCTCWSLSAAPEVQR